MQLFSMALRNVKRSRHRTWVTVGAMGFAGFFMIVYAALMEGFIQTTEQNAIGMELGEIQLHAEGFREDPDLYKRIFGFESVVERLERSGYKAAPRLYGVGLAAASVNSAGIQLRGIDIDREKQVTSISEHIMTGHWLVENKPHEVVIGRKLAGILGVSLGSEIVVVSQAADGSMANDLYWVRGILKSVGAALDGGGFLMTGAAFRELMAVPDGVHEIAVVGVPEGELEASTAEIHALFPDLEVKNWRELAPVIARILDMSGSSLVIMLVITYVAVGILTLNAMLMSVFERIREFGVMKALGLPPLRLFTLIGLETVIQIVMASILAIICGVPLSLYFEDNPIDLSALASTSSSIAGIAIDPIWASRLTWSSVVLPVVYLALIAGVAILYPGGKAALIRPVEALRHR